MCEPRPPLPRGPHTLRRRGGTGACCAPLRAQVRWKLGCGPRGTEAHTKHQELTKEALCFGWIDSTVRRFDDDRVQCWFSPRRPRSAWSAVNKRYVEELEASGRMAEPGRAAIARAQADGTWYVLKLRIHARSRAACPAVYACVCARALVRVCALAVPCVQWGPCVSAWCAHVGARLRVKQASVCARRTLWGVDGS